MRVSRRAVLLGSVAFVGDLATSEGGTAAAAEPAVAQRNRSRESADLRDLVEHVKAAGALDAELVEYVRHQLSSSTLSADDEQELLSMISTLSQAGRTAICQTLCEHISYLPKHITIVELRPSATGSYPCAGALSLLGNVAMPYILDLLRTTTDSTARRLGCAVLSALDLDHSGKGRAGDVAQSVLLAIAATADANDAARLKECAIMASYHPPRAFSKEEHQ